MRPKKTTETFSNYVFITTASWLFNREAKSWKHKGNENENAAKQNI